MEREITGIERRESLGRFGGALFKVYYTMGTREYELMVYARDELGAYKKFGELVDSKEIAHYRLGMEYNRTVKQKKG